MIPRMINGMLVNGRLYKAVGRYCVYVFGDTYPVTSEKEVQAVRDAFTEGWKAAEKSENELSDIAIQKLEKAEYRRRRPPGGCF